MKNFLLAALSVLLLLGVSACKKDENTAPPPTNRIDYLLPDEKNERLIIYGKFPDDRGTVTLHNNPLAVVSWSSGQIVCSLPYEVVDDYGDVVVKSSDTQSVPRRLYKWVIDFNCVRPHGGLHSDIVEEAHGSVTVRGDIRPAPATVFTNACTELYLGGEIYYSAGGTAQSEYDCGKVVAHFDSTNTFEVKSRGMKDLPGKTHFQGYKDILPNGFDVHLDFLEWEIIPMKVTNTSCNGYVSETNKKWSSQLDFMDGYDAIPLRFEVGSHNIKADSITREVYNSTQLIWEEAAGDQYRRRATFSWKSTQFPSE